MKRIVAVLLIAVLLCACTAVPAEPVIETDIRAEETPIKVEEDTVESIATEVPPEEQPTEAPEEPTEASEEPTEAPETPQTLAQHIVAAWESENLLEGMAPYSEADILDLYGIDLSACKSGAGYAEIVGFAQEVILVETDEAAAIEIEELLKTHLDQVKETYRSYDAEAYALAEKAVLERRDGVVLMIVSPNAEAMKAVFEKLLP